ncbi:plasmid transfer ATPase TraJ [Photorhabdus asymbiotica]|uniref:plasmid transfer ATPase TraJ n=1 Tax=Photorhabdus asymbiotica TaxID=291112 RepID=UPI003DA76434
METDNQISGAIANLVLKQQPSVEGVKSFLVKCARNDVSDILLQGGAKIWSERHGRQICVTPNFNLLQNRMDLIVSELWGDHIRGSLRQGKIYNTTFQIKGQEEDPYGLKKGEVCRFRVNFTQATVNGNSGVISATLRVLNSHIPKLKSLNLEQELEENLLPASGLGLIGGQTGSGKSTLMAATLQHSGENFIDRKVITLEHPVEYLLGGKDWIAPEPAQSEVGVDIPSFADGLSLSALRRAPKIIGIGELLEAKAFEAALVAGESGHFCMGTLHISSVGEAFPRSLFMYPTGYREAIAYSLLKAIKYIVVQKLIRSLDGKRIAVREFVVFDQEYKNKLLEEPYYQWGKIIDRDLAKSGQTIPQKAFKDYQEGLISKQDMIEVAGTMKDFKKLEDGTYGN